MTAHLKKYRLCRLALFGKGFHWWDCADIFGRLSDVVHGFPSSWSLSRQAVLMSGLGEWAEYLGPWSWFCSLDSLEWCDDWGSWVWSYDLPPHWTLTLNLQGLFRYLDGPGISVHWNKHRAWVCEWWPGTEVRMGLKFKGKSLASVGVDLICSLILEGASWYQPLLAWVCTGAYLSPQSSGALGQYETWIGLRVW
jgi:hypothetical protein